MSTLTQTVSADRLRSSPLTVGFGGTDILTPLNIAVVNNMSDSALRVTEHQICSLLQPASAGMLVNLRFYAFPCMKRSEAARAHIAQCYETISDLEDNPPDGLIVTGAEPRAQRFEGELFWPSMTRLIDWVDEQRVPTIWSCLAAHAAVYHRDAIERIPLDRKLSGVFQCRIETAKHQVLHGLPRKWRVPHSRRNGLSRKQLSRYGYDILSWSREAGVDMFVKHDRSLQLYLQGHPEYGPGTLITEYRRDLLRLSQGDAASIVAEPVGISGKAGRLGLTGFIRSPKLNSAEANARALMEMDTPILQSESQWSPTARRLFSNWLTHLDATRRTHASADRLHLRQKQLVGADHP